MNSCIAKFSKALALKNNEMQFRQVQKYEKKPVWP